MVETQNPVPQPVEAPKTQESATLARASVAAILHPNFIDHPDKKPDGVLWPKIKPGEKTGADQMYKKFAIDVDGQSVSLYNYLDDAKDVFESLIACLSPEQRASLPKRTVGDVEILDFKSPEVRLHVIQGIVEQIDTTGMDKFATVIAQLGDIQSTDALQVLQALGISYANDIINASAEPQTITTTTETMVKKSRRHVSRVNHGRLQMPSEFSRTLREGEDKKTLELSKETNGLFRNPDGSPTREFQRPVEVDLRTAVALQDILLPPGERLARIRLEGVIAAKKAARAATETTTEEGDELNKILKKLVSDEDAVAEINTLTQQLEQMRQMERAAILVGLKVGYEDGTLAIQPPISADVQRLADEITKGVPAVLGGKTLETNRNQTASMLESVLTTSLSAEQQLVLQKYLSGTSLQTTTSAETVLKDLGLENNPEKSDLLRILADGRRVTRAFGSLAKKQDSYAQVDDMYTRGTVFDMGLKGVEYLYRQGDIKSEVVTETTTLSPEVKTETITPTPQLIQESIPEYTVDESPLRIETPKVEETPEVVASEDPDAVDVSKIPQTTKLPGDPSPEDVAFAERILARRKAERKAQEVSPTPPKAEEKPFPIDNSADSDLGVGMPGFNVPPEAKPPVEEKPWPVDRSDEIDAGVGAVYGEPVERVPSQFEQLLEQDARAVQDSELDNDMTPPEVPTTVDTGKETRKRPSKEDQKKVAAYYIWEKRTSGDELTDQERARAELSAHRQDRVDAFQAQVVLAEQFATVEPTDDQIKLPARINYEVRKRAGAQEVSSSEDQTADWEEARKHLIELRKQAAEEAQAIYQSRLVESQAPPSQSEVDEQAYAHFDRRVTGTDKTDWSEAEKLLKLKVGGRSLQDLQHLGFSQQEIIAFGKIRNKGEIIKRINERNQALGYPLWTDDTATRKFVAYGVREARNVQQIDEKTRAEQVSSLIDTIILKKIGKEGLDRLHQMGVETTTLTALENNDEAIGTFITAQGWQNDEQTIVFLKSVIEAAKA